MYMITVSCSSRLGSLRIPGKNIVNRAFGRATTAAPRSLTLPRMQLPVCGVCLRCESGEDGGFPGFGSQGPGCGLGMWGVSLG